MRVHLIKKETIEDFATQHVRSKTSFNDWMEKLKHADWQQPKDIKSTYNSVDVLGRGTNRIVFDVAGNRYRLICKYAFGERQVHLFVCWIGTHAEYDKLCNEHEQYTINSY